LLHEKSQYISANVSRAKYFCEHFDSEKAIDKKIDWMSVLYDRDLNAIGTEWLIYGQKKRAGNNIFVGNLTVIPTLNLILFAGQSNANETTLSTVGTLFIIDKFIQCTVKKEEGKLLNDIRSKIFLIFMKFLKTKYISDHCQE
jgi:hypothetical protein